MQVALKFVKLLFLSVIALVLLCCFRTFLLTTFQNKPPEICHKDEKQGYISANDSWKEFKRSLQFKSVSYSPGIYNRDELQKMLDFILEGRPKPVE